MKNLKELLRIFLLASSVSSCGTISQSIDEKPIVDSCTLNAFNKLSIKLFCSNNKPESIGYNLGLEDAHGFICLSPDDYKRLIKYYKGEL